MLTCEACQNLLADSVYERLPEGDQRSLDEHLARCNSCQELCDELSDSAARLRRATDDNVAMATETGVDARLDELWAKLEPELDRIDARRYRQIAGRAYRRYASAAVALAACLVLGVGFLIQAPSREDSAAVIPQQVVVQQPATAEFLDYLSRAQTVLQVLANTEQSNVSAIPIDRSYAGLMALEAGMLDASMAGRLSASQQNLLRDVEYLLLQFANFSEGELSEGLEILQIYLHDNTVLFRIKLAELKEQSQVV